ncbi:MULTISPECIES: group I truncated hemoglobin [Aestuariibaculum]|uniref:Group 1 truncated hemoglobin n=1 Tax=Aestuariibaculum lutulentum TaxID=2920935 RepID=A0ABS9RF49_9FLAO|nr:MULTISPECIES: group 1 truncated hemoglobin [Aestuariibaculum]MCH4551578.1 group 1 truncated hemoglobin [Aestuariibaculum lutulentum]MCR8666672.1 group 1 truncated hemoglobin [Aestuariibaculum sp. M13]
MSKSLYERLGGNDGISAIVRRAISIHMENPDINARFLPYKERPEYFETVVQHSINFFNSGSGGPAVYEGRDMETAHRGMNISPKEYMCAIDDIFIALDEHKIDDDTKKDVLAVLWSLKGMIIAK